MEACQKYKHSDVYILFHNVTATVDLFWYGQFYSIIIFRQC